MVENISDFQVNFTPGETFPDPPRKLGTKLPTARYAGTAPPPPPLHFHLP